MRNLLAGGLVFAMAVASMAYGGEITWDGTNVQSGNWNDGTSWIGGQAPTSSDTALIKTANTIDVSATADGAFKIFKVQANGGDLTVNMGLGAHSLVGLNSAFDDRMHVNGTTAYSATLNLTSGTISNICALVTSDSGPNGHVTISGKGTKVLAYRDNTRIGSTYGNSTFEVLDGAYFRSGRETVIGYSDNDRQSNIVIRVSGAGSVYEDGNAKDNTSYTSYLPKYGSGGKVIVENGACWTNGSNKASYMAFSDTRSHDNDFIVRNDGNLYLKNAFYIGQAGPLNHFFVMDGSSAYVGNAFFVGAAATSYGNTVLITTNSWMRNANHTAIGYNGSASNRMDVVGANAAFTNTAFDIGVGRAANYNTLRIADGGSVYGSRRFAVGAPLSFDARDVVCGPVGNEVIVEGKGSVLHNKGTAGTAVYSVVGWYGTNNTMTVRDGGTFRSDVQLHVGETVSAVSNRLVITGKGAYLQVGGESYMPMGEFNELRVEAGARADIKKLHIGTANGSYSNVLFVGFGALVTNVFATLVGTSGVTDPAQAVGNGVIVSNATFYSSMQNDPCYINSYGLGGYMRIVDGGQFVNNQNIRLAYENAGASLGRIDVIGTNSLLRALQFDIVVGGRGHHNTLNVEDGAKVVGNRSIGIGGTGDGTISAVASASNNTLRVCNGYIGGNGGTRPNVYCHGAGGRIIWEGTYASSDISALYMTAGTSLELRFDKDGISPFGPCYETYLIDADHKPLVEKITIDATEYVKNHAGTQRTFTILKSDDNRQCRVVGTTTDLPSADFDAINAAIAERIECIPSSFVKVTKVDMERSRIEVSVEKPKNRGLIISVR